MRHFLAILLGSGLALAASPSLINRNPQAEASKPSLVLDALGYPVVAWNEKVGDVTQVLAQRWDGLRWQDLASPINRNPQQNAAYTVLALDPQGRPLLAWTEKNNNEQGKLAGSGKLYVSRWDGRRWQALGDSPSQSPGTVSDIPRMALDNQGRPYVQWSEMPPDFNGDSVYVGRWTGQAWEVFDRGTLSVDISSSSRSRAIAVNRQNQPVLTWSLQLYQQGVGALGFGVYAGGWNGRSWVPLGGLISSSPEFYAAAPSIAINQQNQPIVAWHESGGGKGYNVYVRRWNGQAWMPFGGSVNDLSGLGSLPQLVLDSADRPVVGWLENQGSIQLRIKRWNGQNWVALGGALNGPKSNVESFALAIDGKNTLWAIWGEESGGQRRVWLARWSGQSWVGIN